MKVLLSALVLAATVAPAPAHAGVKLDHREAREAIRDAAVERDLDGPVGHCKRTNPRRIVCWATSEFDGCWFGQKFVAQLSADGERLLALPGVDLVQTKVWGDCPE